MRGQWGLRLGGLWGLFVEVLEALADVVLDGFFKLDLLVFG